MGQQGLRGGGTQGGCRSPGADMRRDISETPFTIQLMSEVIISFLADLNHHVVINYP